jgi:hypothetical protein
MTWDKGYDDGVEHTKHNYKVGYNMTYPEAFNHRADPWSCGFAEGVIAQRHTMLSEMFPNYKSISFFGNGVLEVDGKTITI